MPQCPELFCENLVIAKQYKVVLTQTQKAVAASQANLVFQLRNLEKYETRTDYPSLDSKSPDTLRISPKANTNGQLERSNPARSGWHAIINRDHLDDFRGAPLLQPQLFCNCDDTYTAKPKSCSSKHLPTTPGPDYI
ncbi:unnamed protein product [Heligmosomoides polygyrus]|uniref:Uncharacterized protein n=1 Tax=Heligmosomoides polygyrus TaxID=6339 RepID=A0A183GW12_HELPZ|nr:unnamed protein product [Heligmosomoides polygyrus]